MTNLPRKPTTTAEPIPLPEWHHNLRFLAAVTFFMAVMFILGVALIQPWLALIYYYIAGKAPTEFGSVFVRGEFPNLGGAAVTLLLGFITVAFFFLLFKALSWLIKRLHPIGLLRWLVWGAGILMLVVFVGYLANEALHWLMISH